MKHARHILLITALIAASLGKAYSLTADELGRYLGVSSWSSRVDLVAESFTTEIWTIKDGAPGKRLIEGMTAWNKKPEKGFTVMIGTQNGKYRVVVAYGGGVTMSTSDQIPTFSHTLSQGLPETIKEGDFPLFGQPKMLGNRNPSDITAFTNGFLLRIKKK